MAQWLAQAPSVKSDGAVRPRLVAPPEVEKKKPAEPVAPKQPAAAPAPALSEATLPQIWEQAVSSVGPMQAAIWKKAHSQAILGPNSLAIRFANGYNQECEECQKPDRQARLEEAFAHILGRPCQVRVELDTTLTPARSEPTAEASPVRRARRQRDELLELPLLKKAADVLGAKLVRMDDDFGSGGEAGPEKDTPEES